MNALQSSTCWLLALVSTLSFAAGSPIPSSPKRPRSLVVLNPAPAVNPLLRYAIRSAAHGAVCGKHDPVCEHIRDGAVDELAQRCTAGERSDRCLGYWRTLAEEGFRVNDQAMAQIKSDQRFEASTQKLLEELEASNQALTNDETHLKAQADDAKRETEAVREHARRSIDEAYSEASHYIDEASAEVARSSDDTQLAESLAIMNAAVAPRPAPQTYQPGVHCTSQRVGQGAFARVETDCN